MDEKQKWIIFWSTTLTAFFIFCVPGMYGLLLLEFNIEFAHSNTLLLILRSNILGFFMSYLTRIVCRILGFKIAYLTMVLISVLGLTLMAGHNKSVYVLILAYGVLFAPFGISVILTYTFITAKMFPDNNRYSFFTTSMPAVLSPFSTFFGSILLELLMKVMTWEKAVLVFSALILSSGSFAFTMMCKNNGSVEHEENERVELKDNCESKRKHTRSLAMLLVYVLWGISWICKFIMAQAPFIIMVQHSTNLGIDSTRGTSLVAVASVLEGISRLLTSVVGGKLFQGRMLLVYICILPINIIANVFGAYSTMYWQLVLYCVFMGLSGGPMIAGMYSVNNELLNGLYVNELYTLSFSANEIGYLIGLSLYTVVYSATGSYQWTFGLNAIFSTIAFIICSIFKMYKHTFIQSLTNC